MTADSRDFRIVGSNPASFEAHPYRDRAALDFVRGRYWVEGDLLAAVRAYTAKGRPDFLSRLGGWLVRLSQSAPLARLRAQQAAHDIRFHYDRSNDFYQQFLDSRMVYSCAYFRNAADSLEQAQTAKLDLICRKLALQPGEHLLDIGCGWGALLMQAAQRYGAHATGCTLSRRQWQYARSAVRELGLEDRVTVQELDYRQITGCYDKLASVGMFEHVGRSSLAVYFAKMRSLLKRDGLFLNHGIVRRSGLSADGESLFLQRKVFPGTALVGLPDVIREAESAGFEVLDVENLRPSYALTCRAWVDRLQKNAASCRRLVDEETYRTWLLYLAGSAVNFEDGHLDVHQILLARRDSGARPLTREYMFQADFGRPIAILRC